MKSVCDSNIQTAARFLALTIHNIDNLLEDWYPGLDTINIYGENLVTRLIPCQKCIKRIISMGASPLPRYHQSRKTNEDVCNGDDYSKNSSPHRKSTFYLKAPGNNDNKGTTLNVESTRDTSSTLDESPERDVASPSSDSGSSSGLGTDDSSRESSPVPHRAEGNGYEQDTTDSEAEQSRTSSQTSGVPPSPRHGSGVGGRIIASFQFEECVVISQTSDHITCPIDGDLPLNEAAPDVVSIFQSIIDCKNPHSKLFFNVENIMLTQSIYAVCT